MEGPQYVLVLRELLPRTLILEYSRHPHPHALDDGFAQSAVVLRALVVVYACSQVDDHERIRDEGEAVDDSVGRAALDVLEIVLDGKSV